VLEMSLWRHFSP